MAALPQETKTLSCTTDGQLTRTPMARSAPVPSGGASSWAKQKVLFATAIVWLPPPEALRRSSMPRPMILMRRLFSKREPSPEISTPPDALLAKTQFLILTSLALKEAIGPSMMGYERIP